MSDEHILNRTHNAINRAAESLIYGGRWVIAPMYVGLLAALVVYTLRFLQELYHLCLTGLNMTEGELMLSVLSLIDTCMLGNLILLIMIGSYSIFIRKLEFPAHNRPQWLDHITSGSLKIKMGMSIVGVSSIHLLKSFIDANSISVDLMVKQGALHLLFVVSGLGIAYIDKISHGAPAPHVEPPPSTPSTH